MQTFKHMLLKLSLHYTEQYTPGKCTMYCLIDFSRRSYKSMSKNQVSSTLAYICLSILLGFGFFLSDDGLR